MIFSKHLSKSFMVKEVSLCQEKKLKKDDYLILKSYHDRRDANPREYGVGYGSTKHAYSSGFSDGAEGRIIKGVPYTFKEGGAKAVFSYKMGRARAVRLRKLFNK